MAVVPNNKITHLLLDRVAGQPLPDAISVSFTPEFSDNTGANVADADATHIKLTLEIVGGDINVLKTSTNQDMVKGLAQHIGEAKAALNKDIDDNDLLTPLGLRGLNDDKTFSGGKKSKSKKQAKSKKHPKSKKRKSVRRR